MPEIGSIFENRYKILSSLGQGGFASAFLAEEVESGLKVVIKMPHLSQLGDPAVHERFRREMAIGEMLDHMDVPRALELSEGSPPYLVLKYFEGESLAKVLEQRGRFSIEETVKMVSNLLDALDYCHQKGVFHRDLKPENLLLAPDGHLKIVDFGIALMESAPRVTWRGFSGLMGTPEYMAPEQIKGERGGAWSDIYAVGCLTYHLLSGSPPFTGDNPMAVMFQHMTKSAKPLNSVVPGLHPGIWAAVRRALRRRKEERYPTAREMANDLRWPDLADLRWAEEPDPPLVTVPNAGRNYRVMIGAGVAIALLVLLILAFFRLK